MTTIYLNPRALGRTDLMRAVNDEQHDPYTARWFDWSLAGLGVAMLIAAFI